MNASLSTSFAFCASSLACSAWSRHLYGLPGCRLLLLQLRSPSGHPCPILMRSFSSASSRMRRGSLAPPWRCLVGRSSVLPCVRQRQRPWLSCPRPRALPSPPFPRQPPSLFPPLRSTTPSWLVGDGVRRVMEVWTSAAAAPAVGPRRSRGGTRCAARAAASGPPTGGACFEKEGREVDNYKGLGRAYHLSKAQAVPRAKGCQQQHNPLFQMLTKKNLKCILLRGSHTVGTTDRFAQRDPPPTPWGLPVALSARAGLLWATQRRTSWSPAR